MLGIFVSVPVASFRKGLAREYLETELIPPPSTCYGFLLSLVGETQRRRHAGCRLMPVLLGSSPHSRVLRTVWRVKKTPLGSPGNARPDYQQILTSVEAVVWLDSGDEISEAPTLEARVHQVLESPRSITRFGGLSLGESTHLVDEVLDVHVYARRAVVRGRSCEGRAFLSSDKGRLTLPVWVDHVGSAGTRWVTGEIVQGWAVERAPDRSLMHTIPLVDG